MSPTADADYAFRNFDLPPTSMTHCLAIGETSANAIGSGSTHFDIPTP